MPLSLDAKAVFALLDVEEQQELLLERETAEAKLLESVDAQWLLVWLTLHRGPFIKMAAGFCALLTTLEAHVKGNVGFVVLEDEARSLTLDFGPQLRGAVATALARSASAEAAAALDDRVRELVNATTRLVESSKGTVVSRPNTIGRLLQKRADNAPTAAHRFRDERLAEHFSEASHEYHPDDLAGMTSIVEELVQLGHFVNRLNTAHPTDWGQAHANALRKVTDKASNKFKAMHAARTAARPFPARQASNAVFAACKQKIAAVTAAFAAVSAFTDAASDLADFFRLELWKERWRIYELWALAALIQPLMALGAGIRDSVRVQNGRWRLKFSDDSDPVLGLTLLGVGLDVYYNYYEPNQAGPNTRNESKGNMPDVLLRTSDGQGVVVVDPKHGLSYSRNDLRAVAVDYGRAFGTYGSYVVDYFDREPAFDRVSDTPSVAVLYGFRPDRPDALRDFSRELSGALRGLMKDRAIARTAVAVLLDVSASTEAIRDRLVSAAVTAIGVLPSLDSACSIVLTFAAEVVRRGAVTDLVAGILDVSTTGGGTVVEPAAISGLEHLSLYPGQREIWLFSDGEGTLDEETLRGRFQSSATVLRVWTAAGSAGGEKLQVFARSLGGDGHLLPA